MPDHKILFLPVKRRPILGPEPTFATPPSIWASSSNPLAPSAKSTSKTAPARPPKSKSNCWRHEHLFKARERGTEMLDRVEFQLKGGRTINLLLTPLVKLLLRGYFAHRHHRTVALLRN